MRVLHVAALLSPTLVLFALAHARGAAPDDPQLAIKNTVVQNLLGPAFKLAIATVDRNTHQGILAAGADYGGEWTRDCAINAWNGVSLLRPRVAETSLWSVTKNRQTIGHQYWDKIIWTIGAWNHYKVTGSRDFLAQAYPLRGIPCASWRIPSSTDNTGCSWGLRTCATGSPVIPSRPKTLGTGRRLSWTIPTRSP